MNLTRDLTSEVQLRLIRPDDATSLCEAQFRCREQLNPFEPDRSDEWHDPAFQEARIRGQLESDLTVPWVLTAGGRVIGTATLSHVTRGPWWSADIGYWVDVAEVGRGLASAAVAAICELADSELHLHRISAGTRVDNAASQRVLTKNGFVQYGFAPDYLYVGGAWRDHNLYQRILNTRPPGQAAS